MLEGGDFMTCEGKDICYKDLKTFYEENKGEVYTYQNFEEAGKDEVNSIFMGNDLPTFDMIGNSKRLLRIIDLIIEDESNISEAISFIEEHPLIKYYGEFIVLINGRIESNIISKRDIIKVGRSMAFKGSSKEEIKLGLTLLFFDEIEEIKEKLFVLALYNEYSFYVAKLLVKLKDSDEILFDLAKVSQAAGRVMYTNYIDVLNKNMKEWMVCEGWKGEYFKNFLWNTTIIKVGYDYFLNNDNINEKTFRAFGEVVNNIFVYYNYEKLSIFNRLVKRYIDLFEEYGKDTKSYLTLGNVYRYILDESIMEDEYYKKTQKFYLKIDWTRVFNDAIKDETVDSPLLFQLAVEMDEDLSVEELNMILKRNPRDYVWYKYIEMLNETSYSNLLISTVKESLNLKEIFIGPKDLSKEVYVEDSSDYSLLLIALESLTRESIIRNQDFLVECLNADLIDIRLSAIDKLWSIEDRWTRKTLSSLEDAIENEVVDWIRKKLIFIIYENNNNFIITDINNPEEEIEGEDIFLTNIIIPTVTANKLKYNNELVKEGDVLTLINGLDGYKEDRIFITTSFGLVLGELSSREGEVIKNLIMAGERIAGKIEKYDDNIDFMYISLYKKGDYLIKELSNIINEKFKFLIED